MIIELQRAFDLEEYGYEEECGICRQPFRVESVLTQAATDGLTDMGHACEPCMEYLSTRSPGLFPTVEEYRDLLRRYPEAIAPTGEEADAFDAATHEASWLWKAPA